MPEPFNDWFPILAGDGYGYVVGVRRVTAAKIASDGGSTAYYDLPLDARDVGDLIEHRKMTFNVGNIFKACYRLGLKDGATDLYDLNKIVYFAKREIAVLAKREAA